MMSTFMAYFTSPYLQITGQSFCQCLSYYIPHRFVVLFAIYVHSSCCTPHEKITRCNIRRTWGTFNWPMGTNVHRKFITEKSMIIAHKMGLSSATTSTTYVMELFSIQHCCVCVCVWQGFQHLWWRKFQMPAPTVMPEKSGSVSMAILYDSNEQSCVNLLFHLSWTVLHLSITF